MVANWLFFNIFLNNLFIVKHKSHILRKIFKILNNEMFWPNLKTETKPWNCGFNGLDFL